MLPSLIIFVNNDLSAAVQATLVTQLYIDEAMDGAEFDARIVIDPNYPLELHLRSRRILVIRPFTDLTNRALADIVIFVKEGLASIELTKFGPPGQTFPVARLHLNQLVLHKDGT